ncbi:uncharacterized protein LOC131323791 [Rhododendron vialii]|uniref:uncharacterized protein LOC131323791 n=1 Tax=Rhododendron vialii TaxID=182163 RepID=UPI00265EB5EF|nr:uncharacterized protein LOC131323791 [Rhododendron vialii]
MEPSKVSNMVWTREQGEASGPKKPTLKHGGQESNAEASPQSTAQPKGSEQEDLIKDASPSPQRSTTFGESDVEDTTQSIVKIMDKEKHFQSQPINVETDEHENSIVVLRTPDDASIRHLRPLYIKLHMNGQPVSKVLVDNGAVVNILPFRMLKVLNKTNDDLIPTEVIVGNFAGGCSPAKGVISLQLQIGTRRMHATFFALIFLKRRKQQEWRNLLDTGSEELATVKATFKSPLNMKELGLAALKPAPAKLDDDRAQVKDPTEEAPRRMKDDVLPQVKKEMERLFEAKFIRPVNYAEWVSNVVPVLKKNGKVRVCVDFRDLNTASPKDEYPMHVADLLVDATVGYQMLSFMDVYIDDVVVKSNSVDEHLHHLEQTLERMRRYNLKINPLKCVFGVTAGNFLGFLMHQKGIEIDKTKADAVLKAQAPTNKEELQQFLGKINFLRRFIANLSRKTMAFSPLLKLKSEQDFRWEQKHQKAFDILKQSLRMELAGHRSRILFRDVVRCRARPRTDFPGREILFAEVTAIYSLGRV